MFVIAFCTARHAFPGLKSIKNFGLPTLNALALALSLFILNHSRRRANVFGDARFLFCPNLIKFAQMRISLLLLKFRLNFAQKILLEDAVAFLASPGPTALC